MPGVGIEGFLATSWGGKSLDVLFSLIDQQRRLPNKPEQDENSTRPLHPLATSQMTVGTKTIINPTFFQTSMTIPPRYENHPAHYQLTTARGSLQPDCASARERQVNAPENASDFGPDEWEHGRKYITRSGIRVRSTIEKIIADFLTASDLTFTYEPKVKIGNLFVRPDFYFPEYGLLYEHFGLDTPEYLQAAEVKIRNYQQAGIPFIYTTFNDEPDIEDVIVDKLALAILEM